VQDPATEAIIIVLPVAARPAPAPALIRKTTRNLVTRHRIDMILETARVLGTTTHVPDLDRGRRKNCDAQLRMISASERTHGRSNETIPTLNNLVSARPLAELHSNSRTDKTFNSVVPAEPASRTGRPTSQQAIGFEQGRKRLDAQSQNRIKYLCTHESPIHQLQSQDAPPAIRHSSVRDPSPNRPTEGRFKHRLLNSKHSGEREYGSPEPVEGVHNSERTTPTQRQSRSDIPDEFAYGSSASKREREDHDLGPRKLQRRASSDIRDDLGYQQARDAITSHTAEPKVVRTAEIEPHPPLMLEKEIMDAIERRTNINKP
jgi:hypothetical protein